MYKVVKRKKVIPVEEVPKIVDCIKKYGLKVLKVGIEGEFRSIEQALLQLKKSNCSLMEYVYIVQKESRLEITTRWYENKPCTYIVSLDDKVITEKAGLDCFRAMSKYYQIPKIIDKEEWQPFMNKERGTFGPSASPLVDYNKKYDKQELHDCYEYDLNSAYSSVILQGIPDLNNPSELSICGIRVQKGQIGFLLDDQLTLVHEGHLADIVFPLIPCPEGLKNFINKYYKQKKTSTGKKKQEAKDMLNLPIGYCQRYNPFFRAYVVHSCNERIAKVIDKDTLFWNTDAIFSKVRRKDLELGIEIGQWKEIKCNTLRYTGNTYQVNDEIPVYRGVPKKWFEAYELQNGKKYNLLTDPVPPRINIYKWNWTTLELEINEIWLKERNKK